MSDEFKDVSTVPTLTLEPFQEEEKKKPVVQPEEPKLDDTILTEEERRMVDALAQAHRKRWQISQKVLWKM